MVSAITFSLKNLNLLAIALYSSVFPYRVSNFFLT